MANTKGTNKPVLILTAKQERFCYEYCLDFNAAQACIRAGYSKRTARFIGGENLTKPNIQERIKEMQDNLAENAGLSALKVLLELAKIAFTDAGQLRETWIRLKNFDELTDEQKACIQEISIKQIKLKDATGAGIQAFEEWVKIKLYDKQKALDAISNILGLNAPVRQGVNVKPMNKIEASDYLSMLEKVAVRKENHIQGV